MPNYLTAEDVAGRLERARHLGNGFVGKCPAHDDGRASLKVSPGERATVLWCHAGCSTEDVLAALGVRQEELFYDYDPKLSGGTAELRMEMAALKRELYPPPPLPETIWGLIGEAFSLPQPWHDQGMEQAGAAHPEELATPPRTALRRRQITRDTLVYDYFTPYASAMRMSGEKTMQLVEWGMQKLEAFWQERLAAQ